MSRYYARVSDKVYGPFGIDDLRKAVTRGQLSRQDSLSLDRESWTRAESMLPEIFAAPPAAPAAMNETLLDPADHRPAPPPPPAPTAAATAFAAPAQPAGAYAPFPSAPLGPYAVPTHLFEKSNFAVGLGVGIGLLAIIHVPFMRGETATWWWEFFGAQGAGGAAAAHVFYFIIGIALCVIPIVLRGLPRGATMLGLGLTGLVFTSVLLNTGSIALVGIPACALLVSCIWQQIAPGRLSTRLSMCISGGLTVLAAGICLGVSFRAQGLMGGLSAGPWYNIMTLIFGIIGALGVLAAGVLGVLGIMPRYNRKLNFAAWLTAVIALGVLVLALFVFGGGNGLDRGSGWEILNVIKVTLLMGGMGVITVFGAVEFLFSLLRWSSRPRPAMFP